MSPVLHFDIIALIIDIVGENKDINLLKELSQVSHSFLQICSKHIFATVELCNVDSKHVTSSKKGFVKLLKSRPDVVKHIRKLKYYVGRHVDGDIDHQLPPILLNFLPTTSCLNCLTITGSNIYRNDLDSSLTSAFLHLMHLPTINHIDLTFIVNFPLFSLVPSVNLNRLDISLLMLFDPWIDPDEADCWPDLVVQSEMPKIREFRTSWSAVQTTKLLHAETQDGRPAFNFMSLRRLSVSVVRFKDELNIRYLLQNAKLLEELHLEVAYGQSIVGFLLPSPRTLRVLDLRAFLSADSNSVVLGGFCEELEALAGHNMLEALSFTVRVFALEEKDFVGSSIQNLEKVLVKPGWPALRQISLKISIKRGIGSWKDSAELCEALQSLPDKYLSHLSNLESVAFDYSAHVVRDEF